MEGKAENHQRGTCSWEWSLGAVKRISQLVECSSNLIDNQLLFLVAQHSWRQLQKLWEGVPGVTITALNCAVQITFRLNFYQFLKITVSCVILWQFYLIVSILTNHKTTSKMPKIPSKHPFRKIPLVQELWGKRKSFPQKFSFLDPFTDFSSKRVFLIRKA